jgi:hypothetical protein
VLGRDDDDRATDELAAQALEEPFTERLRQRR